MITFRINKALRNFEEYPNDVARGFVIEHMPIYYHLTQMSQYQQIYSNSILIQTPEPDFSMPFNVNAFTNMLFGCWFVNTVYTLFSDPDDDKEKELKEL